jgi:hypothetical protein
VGARCPVDTGGHGTKVRAISYQLSVKRVRTRIGE